MVILEAVYSERCTVENIQEILFLKVKEILWGLKVKSLVRRWNYMDQRAVQDQNHDPEKRCLKIQSRFIVGTIFTMAGKSKNVPAFFIDNAGKACTGLLAGFINKQQYPEKRFYDARR